jgi:general secretion pathway protein E
LEQLGFPAEIAQELVKLSALPNGMILVTGPTGSGKTTTLYALLQTLVGTSRNIISLEDPIEYELPGIVQSQVDPDHDYTFASGLRSVLRHDPDVILVGEIRDLETAQTAVDAALTGHLVFSTLHTNSAVEAIPRLLSMGVSPYTFAPALRGVLAQRLLRTLRIDLQKPGAAVDPSDSSAYDGRTVLPELLVVDDEIRDLILQNETSDHIEQKAVERGYRTMLTWGGLLINSGRTTRAEVDRVTA